MENNLAIVRSSVNRLAGGTYLGTRKRATMLRMSNAVSVNMTSCFTRPMMPVKHQCTLVSAIGSPLRVTAKAKLTKMIPISHRDQKSVL